jgi:SAM-dependent methyltransferase
MLAIARSKLPDVRFEVGDIEHLPFDDDEFDVAIVSLALCHLADLVFPDAAKVAMTGLASVWVGTRRAA